MKITLKGDVNGTRNGEDWPRRGTTVDLPEDEARQLIGSGMAVEAEKGAEVHPFGAGNPHVVGPVETAAVATTASKRG